MLLMKFIIGMMTPEMNCAFHAASNSRALISLNWLTESVSRPKAFTITWPVYISSTWPFSSPELLLLRGEALLRALGDAHDREGRGGQGDQGDQGQPGADRHHHDEDPDDGADRGDELGQALLEAVLMLSMSLVTRLMISPWVFESKYLSGSRASLAFTSLRMS